MPPNRRRPSARICLPRPGSVSAAVAAVVLVALLLAGGDSRAGEACTISWDGGAGTTSWTDSANWTGDHQPGTGDEVCIGSGASVDFLGSGTVGGLRVDGSLTIGGLGDLTVAGTHESAGAGTLTLKSGRLTPDGALGVGSFRQQGGILLGSGTLSTPDFRWGGGAEVGSGTTKVTGTGASATLSGAVHTLDASRRLRLDAGSTATWTAGDLELRDHARLENAGLLDIHGDQDFTGCCGTAMTVANEPGGTIRKSEGDATTTLTYAFENDGAVEVKNGTFAISGGDVPGAGSGGSFDVSDGATLAFTGSDFTLGSSSSVTGHGGGGLLFKVGQVRLGGSVDAPVELDGASAYAFFDSDVTVPAVKLKRGFLSGSGTLTTPGFAWTGGQQTGSGTTDIAAGGDGLTVSGSGDHGLYGRKLKVGSGADAAWNDGSLTLTDSALVENAGTFDVQGDLSVSGSGAARVRNAVGATFRKSAGKGRAAVGAQFGNDGTIEAAAGTLALSGGLEDYGSQTLGGGTYDVSATLEIPNAQIAHNAANLILDGAGSTVEYTPGGDALAPLASNDDGGSLTVTGGRELSLAGSDHDLVNAGEVTVGPGSALRTEGAYAQSAGTTTLAADSARLGAAHVSIGGGSLRGTGTVESSVANAGTVAPGLPRAAAARLAVTGSPGVLTLTGDYAQTAAGRLAVDIAGPADHDRLDVTGAATLAGALDVTSLGGFAPAASDGFELIRHASLSGEFDDATGLQPDPDHAYQPPAYAPDSTWLRDAPAPVVTVGDASVEEGDDGDTTATFPVSLSFAPQRSVRVDYATKDATAIAPSDYEPATGTLKIAHGHDTAELTVPVHGDAVHEPDETFRLQLTDPRDATLPATHATGTILDDDPAPAKPPHASRTTKAPQAQPAACRDRQAPKSRFRGSRRPIRVRHRRLTARGSARDLGCSRLKRVAVAIGRRQPHSRRRCRFLTKRGRLGKPRRCGRPAYLPARGTARWRLRLRLRAKLPAGRYSVQARAVDGAGNREWRLRRGNIRNRNALTLRVR